MRCASTGVVMVDGRNWLKSGGRNTVGIGVPHAHTRAQPHRHQAEAASHENYGLAATGSALIILQISRSTRWQIL